MEEDEIWSLAEKQAKEDLFLYKGDTELIANNPFIKGTAEFTDYEMAYEHYIMEGLGY